MILNVFADLGAAIKGNGKVPDILYKDICTNVKKNGWKKENVGQDPYAYLGDQWVGYDDPNQAYQ